MNDEKIAKKMCVIQFNSNIAKDNREIGIAFYANIGFFIEIAQMLEYNLRKLLCFKRAVTEIEKDAITFERVKTICQEEDNAYTATYSEKWTLGRLIKKIKNELDLEEPILKVIDEINDYRIKLVHIIFQNNVMTQYLVSSENVQKYINEQLIPMTNKADEVNQLIIRVIEHYRNDLHVYKKSVGIKIL